MEGLSGRAILMSLTGHGPPLPAGDPLAGILEESWLGKNGPRFARGKITGGLRAGSPGV